jgi:phosphoribosyl-AMP cyclohydrolase
MVSLDFEKGGGLLPAIVQDDGSGEVLMLAYMNEDSWKKTLETGKAVFWSRSPPVLWMKGEQSGHFQIVREIRIDCDDDTISPQGRTGGGVAACHTVTGLLLQEVSGDALVIDGIKYFERGRVPMNRLKLGLPKGSLEKRAPSSCSNARAGESPMTAAVIFPTSTTTKSPCSFVRAQEMSRYVENGTLDLGLTAGLGSGERFRRGRRPGSRLLQGLHEQARWVVVVREDSPIRSIEELRGRNISTELVNFSRRYFQERGFPWTLNFLGGDGGQGRGRPRRRHRGSHGNREHAQGETSFGSFTNS